MPRIKKKSSFKDRDDLLKQVKQNTLLYIITTAEIKLNPNHCQISDEAKKKLKWLYLLYYAQNNNISRTANNIEWYPSPHTSILQQSGDF